MSWEKPNYPYRDLPLHRKKPDATTGPLSCRAIRLLHPLGTNIKQPSMRRVESRINAVAAYSLKSTAMVIRSAAELGYLLRDRDFEFIDRRAE
ncbi:MAG: hypothetical protein U0892_01380 [Pirellulales bacterium]